MYLDKEIKATLRDLIHKKEQGMKNGESSNDDLLGLLLQSNSNNSTPKDTGLTIEEVIEECKLFYFAGQETTAVLLTWTLIVLSMHPRWQDQAREEVLHVCGKNSPNIESINHLKIVSFLLLFELHLLKSFHKYRLKRIFIAHMHKHGPITYALILPEDQAGAGFGGSQFTLVL